MSDLFDLTGKVALVTGGSRGLGAAIVRGLAARGADVIIVSRKLERCQALADQIIATGRRALALSCHVGHWQELDALVERCYSVFGKVDILVNNAGMSPVTSSSLEATEEMFDKVIAVNFKGPFRLCALIGSRMAAGAGGSIINVSSIGAVRPEPAYGPYAGAKAALNAVTRAYAFEFGPKVRVNGILPGSFRTDIAKHWPADKEKNTNAAAGRFGEPEEIVTTVLYLASDHSSFTTGALIGVDGGRR